MKNDVKTEKESINNTVFLKYDEYNSFKDKDIVVSFPKGVLYDDLLFEYSISDTAKGIYSLQHNLANPYTPLHAHITLSIRANVPEHLKQKALIVSTTGNGSYYPEGGTWDGDFMTVKTRSFGYYSVKVDTVSPVIKSLTLSQNKNMFGFSEMKFKISDDLSGIESFYGTIDGKWILMEYDYKTDDLFFEFENFQSVQEGKHTFELAVRDAIGNESTYKADFYR